MTHRSHDPRARHLPRHSYSRHSYGHFGRGGSRARRGDVRASILALLVDRPMHGYEMIKELEERTGGLWTPSAGSIYPTLQLLEDEGLVRGEEEDGKRRFELTADGKKQQDESGGKLPWDEVTAGAAPELVRLKRSLEQLHVSAAQVVHGGTDEQRARVRELLEEARRKIYGILAEDS